MVQKAHDLTVQQQLLLFGKELLEKVRVDLIEWFACVYIQPRALRFRFLLERVRPRGLGA